MTEDQDSKAVFAFPPGHYYSPVPSIEEIKLREEYIFDQWPEAIPGSSAETTSRDPAILA